MSEGARTRGGGTGTAEDARAADGARFAAVAHEFKNLLQVIGGLSELLLIRADLEQSARRDLEEIRQLSGRAARLSRQLFEFARKAAPRPESTDLNALLRQCLPTLSRMFGERIALRLELSEQVRPVQVDPMQLEQAILNVVLNARDAIAQRGEIRIATDRVEIGGAGASSLPPGRYSVVRVSDDGSGMDDETQARIFEPYFTTKKEKGGTGLGLPLVRLFVEQAGGDVRVRSRLGAGTTIELLLPEAPDEA